MLRAAVSDAPPTAAQVVRALGPVLADLLGAGAISDVQQAFGDRSVIIFRPDALDTRLTIAIRQDRGSLLAVVLSRLEYMASGEFFAASRSVSAEEQARVEPGPIPVLWPNATASLDFYSEHDEPSGEPAYPAVRDRPFMSLIIRFQLMATEGMTPPGAIALTKRGRWRCCSCCCRL